MADDDNNWLAALRGKSDARQALREQQLMDAVRAAARSRNEATDVRHDEARELERLLFRLRKEKLLDAPASARWARGLPISAAALLVAGIAVTALWPEPHDELPPIIRGAGQLQLIEVDDPNRAAAEVVSRLEANAIAAHRYEASGYVGVSATVPPASVAQLRAELSPLGVSLPASGELKVEFRRKARKP